MTEYSHVEQSETSPIMQALMRFFGVSPLKMTKKLIAFSLVELMISLITISCIAAAFTPVITKKLKKQDVALSLAQTSEITSPCPQYAGGKCELCTQKYCIKCGITSCPKVGNIGQYVDSKNCKCESCQSGDAKLLNCLECRQENQEFICNLCQEGYYLKSEVRNIGNVSKTCLKCGNGNYCEDGVWEKRTSQCTNPPSGYYCDGTKLRTCISRYSTYCSTCNNAQCLSCYNGRYLHPATKECTPCGSSCGQCNPNNPEDCTSCSAAMLNYQNGIHKCISCNIENCFYCANTTTTNGDMSNARCGTCKGGYYLTNDNKTCSPCSTIQNCLLCSNNGKCTNCKEGFYATSSGTCSACSISNCAACDENGKCMSCLRNYHLDNNKCVSDDQNFNCSDSNFMQIGKLCVTRRNMGDSNMLPIPSTVNIANSPKEYCYSMSTKCCWKGETAKGGCTDEYGEYSGCDRTVCNWDAADEICSKFNYAGKTWRLPTESEAANFGKYSVGLGRNGLMLCDQQAGRGSEECTLTANCPGSGRVNGHCEPYDIWTSNEVTSLSAILYLLPNGNWYPATYTKNLPVSVRCVTEME